MSKNYTKLLSIVLLFVVVHLNAQPLTPTLPLVDSLSLDTMQGFSSLAEALKTPEKVIKLVLRKEKFTVFPIELWQFPNLQYLDLSKNEIRDIPDSINAFQNLQVLHLSRNNIEYMPRTIGDLSNLRILEVNQNDLYLLPPQLGKLGQLQVLDLWDNNISRFPEELKQLSGNLKVLDLRSILINYENQERIRSMLPKTKIYMSPPCKCKE
jgi:Leucine-rich repeat (LRR) protein